MDLYTIQKTTIVLNHVREIRLIDEITFPNGIKQNARVSIETGALSHSFEFDSQDEAKELYIDICSELESI